MGRWESICPFESQDASGSDPSTTQRAANPSSIAPSQPRYRHRDRFPAAKAAVVVAAVDDLHGRRCRVAERSPAGGRHKFSVKASFFCDPSAAISLKYLLRFAVRPSRVLPIRAPDS
jgi:hypothetical protein